MDKFGIDNRPYAHQKGEGPSYNFGVDFTVKASEIQGGSGAAILEYVTRKGEEPPDHTHATEDEMFYVLQGEIAFRCGGGTIDLDEGGFIFCREGSSTAIRYAATTQYGSWWSRVRYGMESAAAGEALSETWKRLGERSFRGVRAARLQDGPVCSGFAPKGNRSS